VSLNERLRQMAEALPSDESAVVLTRATIMSLLDGPEAPTRQRDLTVIEVAEETSRAPSTVRGWLTKGTLRGYKLNGRDWRVPVTALEELLSRGLSSNEAPHMGLGTDITAWRSVIGR